MTYEEKLQKVVEKLWSERELTRKAVRTRYTFNDYSFTKIRILDVCKVLLKLQDDEKVLRIIDVKDINSQFDPYDTVLQDFDYERVDFITIELFEEFDGWYETFLMDQKTNLENLDYITMLRIYDVVLDIDEQIQLTRKTTVHVRLLPPMIRYPILFPGDTIGIRHEYCDNRLNSLTYLKDKGIVDDFTHGQDNWNTVITISFVLSKFETFYKKILAEYVKRSKSDEVVSKAEVDVATEPKIEPKIQYDPRLGVLTIEGKTVKLTKDSFRAKMIELITKSDKNGYKEWSWDEVVEKIEGTDDPVTLKANRGKFYPACDGISKFIAQKIGVNDLLIFNKSTVQINPKYL